MKDLVLVVEAGYGPSYYQCATFAEARRTRGMLIKELPNATCKLYRSLPNEDWTPALPNMKK